MSVCLAALVPVALAWGGWVAAAVLLLSVVAGLLLAYGLLARTGQPATTPAAPDSPCRY